MLENRVAEYRLRDLHAEGEWPKLPKRRYGGVTFNSMGEVLLREPLNHFDGYHWTFAKGKGDKDEHPVDTALHGDVGGDRPQAENHRAHSRSVSGWKRGSSQLLLCHARPRWHRRPDCDGSKW